ncbi:MAG: 1-deoxy-D-xylulose-5-phosphate reductoisomerase [Candidatus Omnitrophica bacterium]|nr:1-deoxy-D-xylulose-5-phosphate reductoisomerase [Candidatus Omnitrophota bacterium]
MKRRISILGSTGSIGTQTLDVIRDHPDIFEVVGLAGYRNLDLLNQQIEEFHPKVATASQPNGHLNGASPCRWTSEDLEGLTEVATLDEADTVVVATVGAAGLVPTLAALRAGKNVALANKEVLVMGGDILMAEARRLNRPIIPIDSEHSAILQCLQGENCQAIEKIVITASGGPFREWDPESIRNATVAQALKHPTWAMGRKITVDSATLLNKGLEVIEAHHLFDLSVEKIEVVIHPQSIIHSMVEFTDGAVIAQMGVPDMKVPIQYALTFPERLPRKDPTLDLAAMGQLTFASPDYEKFPCLKMAFESCRKGGGYPAVLSVANEVAVAAFLEERIPFGKIAELIQEALDHHEDPSEITFETILEIDRKTREFVSGLLTESSHLAK